MNGVANKAMIAGLGFFLGLVFFGIGVSLTHYNRLVDPRQPLRLVEWRMVENQLGIRILGEDMFVEVDGEMPSKLGRRANEKLMHVMHETRDWFAAVQQELSTGRWLEKAGIAAHKAEVFFTATMERLKKGSED